MPISADDYQQVVRDFCEQYPVARHLYYKIGEKPQDIYPDYDGDLSNLKATISPKPFVSRDGRAFHGQVNLIAGNTNDIHDANESLRHEILGHYGINTFTTQEKDALLDALIAARQQRGLLGLWNHVDVVYPDVDVRERAEEVYATFTEKISAPGNEQEAVQIRQEGSQSFYETCTAEQPRRMTSADLENITRMVAQGLHDQTRTQQHFPYQEEVRESRGYSMNNRIEEATAKNARTVQDMLKQEATDAADADIDRFDALNAEEREQALATIGQKATANPYYRKEIAEIAPSILAEIDARTLAEKVGHVKSMPLDEVAKQVDADMVRLDLLDDEQARDRQLKEMAACAQANEHYRNALDKVSPQLFVESKNGFNENGTFAAVLGEERIISLHSDRPKSANDEAESLDRLGARARSEADVLESPEDSRSELLAIDDLDLRGRESNYPSGAVEPGDLRSSAEIGTPGDSRSELPGAGGRVRHEEEGQAVRNAEIESILKAKMGREQREHMIDLNEPTGKELGANEFVLPHSVAQRYLEVDGKFYTKERQPRVAFEDLGNKLKMSGADSGVVSDMIAVAKAKQWNTLKLSGSKEFRREAWLEAESQGLKTTGYSPKKADLVALEVLRQERATNNIQPVSERQADYAEQQDKSEYAPRHDLNKNQPQLHTVATSSVTANLEELKKNPALADRTPEALEKLAYWRGIVQEMTKLEPENAQTEAISKYDKAAENPDFLEQLEQSDSNAQENATHVHEESQRKEPELSL
ncbi:MAG: hypothetical protein LBE22_00590 [Azoarcus sp.]|jgi:hypothetical protein|nr:hypothetical protein [Azoarcus sp.]